MKYSTNYSRMSYNEFVAMSIKKAFCALMDAYGLSKEEMMTILDSEESIISTTAKEVEDQAESAVAAEIVESQPLALPEPKEKNVTTSKTSSVFDSPALKAPYTTTPVKKGAITPAPEKTPGDETEENLPTMENLLSISPEYKVLYAGEPPIKDDNRGMITMDALLSEEPVNQILNLGNMEPEGKFGQHTRVCDPKGICPTLTATGHSTLVYIRGHK